MAYKNLLVFLVAIIALAIVANNASAFGDITNVEVNGVPADSGVVNFAGFAGGDVLVLVEFTATASAEDVRVKAWISGERENAAISEQTFDVIAGSTYPIFLRVDMPSDLDEFISESRKLEIVVESRQDGTADERTIDLRVQRESYNIEILSATMDSQVKAGEPLLVDVVIKNRGSHLAEDTYLKIRIPQLGIETQSYFGDLSAVDQGNPDKEDAVERRTYLRIPAGTPAGVYDVILEAWNSDSEVSLQRKVLVVGAGGDTMVVSSGSDKTVSAGEEAVYSLTLVNRGTQVMVYELSAVTPQGLDLSVEPVVVVPAGNSRTVEITSSSMEEGKYSFSVTVSSDGQVIDSKTFRTNVEGEGQRSAGTNATVLLTVILAIIFVVLLVVLIVLLTRKPEKQEELSESSYY